MDEIRMIAALRPDPPAGAVRMHEAVRERLAGALRGQGATAPARLRGTRRKGLMAAGGLIAAASAAIAVIMASGPPVSGGTAPGSRGTAESPVPRATVAFSPPTTAASVLHNAALAALELPAGAPRPGQFVYSQVMRNWPGLGDPITEQRWISADGRRLGLNKITGGPENPSPGQRVDGSGTLPACRNGLLYDPRLVVQRPLPPGIPKLPHYHPGPVQCTPDEEAGYLPGMPTSPDALRPYLLRIFHLQYDPGNTGALLTNIEQMMTTDYLLPQQCAALYGFLAHLPGLSTVPRVANLQGTVGVGVRVNGYKSGDWTIIFDRKTYAPLGMDWTRLGKPAGEMQIKLALVNQVDQLP